MKYNFTINTMIGCFDIQIAFINCFNMQVVFMYDSSNGLYKNCLCQDNR